MFAPGGPGLAYKGEATFPHSLPLEGPAGSGGGDGGDGLAALAMTYSYVFGALSPARQTEFVAACRALGARESQAARARGATGLELPLVTRAFLLQKAI